MPSSVPTSGSPIDDPDAALYWAAAAIRLTEARTVQGNPLTNDERVVFDRYQAAAHSHGFTDAQIRDYLNTPR
ncbi:hypothetical protein ABZX95_17310 [Streptomyces sp. NPDC004232]|uniref:hypothetical protein n=1 Tax=Streptomyces sp. NPDC004232 TaxID=3154454 RepID=UPI0033A21C7A